MSDAEYRDLVVEARFALRDVIWASECGNAVIPLNVAYASLTRTLKAIDAPGDGTPPSPAPKPVEPYIAAIREWDEIGQHGRRRVTIEALGDSRLKVSEIAERIPSKMSGAQAEHLRLHYPHVYTVLLQLMKLGEVDREPAEVVKGRRVWRYYRKSELSGAIAELAQQLESQNGDQACP